MVWPEQISCFTLLDWPFLYATHAELDLLVSAVLLYSTMQAQDLVMGLVLDLVQR